MTIRGIILVNLCLSALIVWGLFLSGVIYEYVTI